MVMARNEHRFRPNDIHHEKVDWNEITVPQDPAIDMIPREPAWILVILETLATVVNSITAWSKTQRPKLIIANKNWFTMRKVELAKKIRVTSVAIAFDSPSSPVLSLARATYFGESTNPSILSIFQKTDLIFCIFFRQPNWHWCNCSITFIDDEKFRKYNFFFTLCIHLFVFNKNVENNNKIDNEIFEEKFHQGSLAPVRNHDQIFAQSMALLENLPQKSHQVHEIEFDNFQKIINVLENWILSIFRCRSRKTLCTNKHCEFSFTGICRALLLTHSLVWTKRDNKKALHRSSFRSLWGEWHFGILPRRQDSLLLVPKMFVNAIEQRIFSSAADTAKVVVLNGPDHGTAEVHFFDVFDFLLDRSARKIWLVILRVHFLESGKVLELKDFSRQPTDGNK